jgi:hypothetical protein
MVEGERWSIDGGNCKNIDAGGGTMERGSRLENWRGGRGTASGGRGASGRRMRGAFGRKGIRRWKKGNTDKGKRE